MAHHEQDIALLQMVKGCTFGKNTPDKFVGNLAAALLVRTLGITIEDSAAYFHKPGTLNGDQVGNSLPLSVRIIGNRRQDRSCPRVLYNHSIYMIQVSKNL